MGYFFFLTTPKHKDRLVLFPKSSPFFGLYSFFRHQVPHYAFGKFEPPKIDTTHCRSPLPAHPLAGNPAPKLQSYNPPLCPPLSSPRATSFSIGTPTGPQESFLQQFFHLFPYNAVATLRVTFNTSSPLESSPHPLQPSLLLLYKPSCRYTRPPLG